MKFYFNHTPGHADDSDIVQDSFENLLGHYHSLTRRSELNASDGIITERSPAELYVSGILLGVLLRKIGDKDLKRLAYKWFTRYPVTAEEEYEINRVYNEYEEIDRTYTFSGEDVTHLLVPSRLGWPVLTMTLGDSWAVSTAIINCDFPDGSPITLHLFHGQSDANYSDTARWLIEKKYSAADLSQRNVRDEKQTDILRNAAGAHRVELSQQALERFKGFTDSEKGFVLEMISQALEQKRLFPPVADKVLVKTCKGKGNELTYEIRHNQGIRIYFQSYKDKLIIGGIHTKAEGVGVEQTADINRATANCEALIDELEHPRATPYLA